MTIKELKRVFSGNGTITAYTYNEDKCTEEEFLNVRFYGFKNYDDYIVISLNTVACAENTNNHISINSCLKIVCESPNN